MNHRIIPPRLRSRQRGFLLNPFRFGGGGGGAIDPYYNQVVFLSNLETTSWVDEKGHSVTATGSPALGTGPSGFDSCASFPSGSNRLLWSPTSDDFDLGSNLFTVEFALKFTAAHGFSIFFGMHPGAYATNSTRAFLFYMYSGAMRVWSGSDLITSSAGVQAVDTWYKLALTYDGLTMRLFQGGLVVGTNTNVNNFYGGNVVAIGMPAGGEQPTQCDIDAVRITKGVCRYTATYTPDASSFPAAGPAYSGSESMFGTVIPGGSTASTNSEVGMRFRPSVNGTITKIRALLPAEASGLTSTANIWSDAGTLLASGTLPAVSTTGWYEVTLGSPLSVVAGTDYVVSSNTPGSHLFYNNTFAGTIGNGLNLSSSPTGAKSVYGTAGAFPTVDGGLQNYYRDVVFVPD